MTEEKESNNNSAIQPGVVTNVKDFGAFVKLQDGRDGLVHISEIANEFVKDINEFVKVGDQISVKVLGVNPKNQKLDLSLKQASSQASTTTKTEDVPFKKPLISKEKMDSFESKMHMFLKRSDEKQIDIRRNLKNKHGIGKKRR